MKINFDTSKQQDPQRDKGVRVSYAPAKRKVARFRWYLILFIVATPLLYFFAKMLYMVLVVSAPGFISFEKITVNASSAGIIEKIAVDVGDTVNVDETLVVLYEPRLKEREVILLAELESLSTSFSTESPALDSLLRERIVLARDMLNYQENILKNNRYLFAQGAATRAELNLAKSQHNKASYTYNEAQSRLLERLESLRRAELIPAVKEKRRVKQIEAELAVIEEQGRRLVHVATKQARVLDVLVQEGMTVSPGTNMLLLADMSSYTVISYLPPRYARYSRVGSRATITFPDGQRVSATVHEDAGLARRLPGDLASPLASRDIMILVQLALDQPMPTVLMIDNMPVSVRFHTTGL